MATLDAPFVLRRPIYVQRTTLTNAEVRTLNATPVTIVPAPGAGKYSAVVRIHVRYVYATAAFDSVGAGDDLEFRYTDASGVKVATNVETTGMLDQTSDKYADTVGDDVVSPVENAVIVVHLASGEVYSAAGGGHLVIDTYYMILGY